MQIRRTLAVAALSTLAVGGFAATPATADTTTNCAAVTHAVKDKHAEFRVAQRLFKATNRPMGQLMKAERAEARSQYRQSRAAIKDLLRQIRTAKGADRKQAVEALRTQRKELAKAHRLLESKRALRAEIRTERRVAKQSWESVKDQLRDLRTAKDSCRNATA